MESIGLAHTGRLTTRLGYGCSSLMGSLGRRPSLALLEAAYDAGIRHFDVAPMYGFGEAEGCLGEFLDKHQATVTVATKFGIAAAKNRSLLGVGLGVGRRLAGPFLRRFPGLKHRLARTVNTVAGSGTRMIFSAEQARLALERSLRELRVEHIDLWLLHEAEAEDLKDEGLLRFLEDAVHAGKIGVFGAGSSADKVPALLSTRPRYCRVLQFEWSVLDPALPEIAAFTIHHRALTDGFRSLHASLLADQAVCARWSKMVGRDLRQASELAALMLKASLERNPQSIVLFSSRRPEHLRENVRVAENSSLAAPALRLHELLQGEGMPNQADFSDKPKAL